ncbi:MAG: CHAD domain-containing protein [Cyanobacteriota bacterium]|nr:CHAD domain-containing protein [Cyanobacteriota bacterium]
MQDRTQERTALPATESAPELTSESTAESAPESSRPPSPGEAHSLENPSIANPPLSSGAFALELIQIQIRRLGKLQSEVVADRDPEPLHQLRVSLRRLRTALVQFAPALELPESVSERRIAAVARRTGLCRDLDVLGLRLREQLLPRLPDSEQLSLEGAMKRLARDRQQAFETLVEALHSPRYLKLLERLHKWQKQPRFTPLGQLPLTPWLADWQAPFSAGLFLHPGWMVEDPAAEALHGLRKQIKRARYSLESLERWCEPPLQAWVQDLRQAQDHLGELHDLQVLNQSFVEREHLRKPTAVPVLHAELKSQQQLHWLRWRELAQRLHQDSHRHTIQRQLLELGSGAH